MNDLNATTSLIAVAGALAGVLLSVLTQAWLARTARREAQTARAEARAEARQDTALAAVTALAKALDDHRRTMWALGDRVLNGADDTALAEAETAKNDSRSAISIPLTTVEVLVPALAPAAHKATRATFAMRRPVDQAALDKLRKDAKAAHRQLVAAARDVFSDRTYQAPTSGREGMDTGPDHGLRDDLTVGGDRRLGNDITVDAEAAPRATRNGGGA